MGHRWHGWRIIALLIVFVVWRLVPTAAQTIQNGSIRGIVRDEQGAVLIGVVVSARSGESPLVYSAPTDASGMYRLQNIPPGLYAVSAELQGFSTLSRADVIVRAGINLAIDLTMTLGPVAETTRVTADAPLLESRDSGNTVNITGTLQRALPLSPTRTWYDMLDVAPGVTSGAFQGNAGIVTQRLSVYGATLGSTVAQIDGADMNSSLEMAPDYIGLSHEIVADVQVKTTGVDASTPLGEGGLIAVTTKSGTNQLSGAGSFVYQAQRWNGNNQNGGTVAATSINEPDSSLGGPIAKDHAWFFAAYQHVSTSTGISRTPAQLAVLKTLVSGFSPIDTTFRSHQVFGKINAAVSRAYTLSGFFQSDRSVYTTSLGAVDGTRLYPVIIGGPGAALRITGAPTSKLTVQAGFSFNGKTLKRDATSSVPVERYYRSVTRSGSTLVGGELLAYSGAPGIITTQQPNWKATASIDFGYFLSSLGGTHDLKAGLYAQPRLHREASFDYTNGGFIRESVVLKDPSNVAGGTVPFLREVYAPSVKNQDQDNSDLAVYAQDQWHISDRLTVNAGLRMDRVSAHDRIFNLTTEKTLAVDPRFGFNWRLTADGFNIVRASWSRVHEGPTIAGASVGTVTAENRSLYDLDLDGIFETVILNPATSQLSANSSVDPNLRQPYSNDWLIAYDRQLPGQVSVDVSLVRRSFRDPFTSVDVNAIYDGSAFVGYRDVTQNAINQLTNNVWNHPTYRGLSFSATRQTSRLQMIASYLRQWRNLEGTWQPGDPASFLQPDAFANDHGIGTTTGAAGTVNSLSGSDMVASSSIGSQWLDHVARLGASFRGPFGFLVATDLVVQSGPWSGPIVTRVTATDPKFGPPTVTLSNGRVVLNPLASTTNRFAFATRADGQFELPTYQRWNARVGRTFRVNRTALDAAINIFNLTNHGADQALVSGGNQQYNTAFHTFAGRQPPRSMQLTIRVSF